MTRRRSTGRPGITKHRTYDVAEIADALDVCHGTVRGWIKQGLPAITDQRPHLVRGADLRAFLDQRRQARKRPLKLGEFYCLPCRDARPPACDMVEHVPRTATVSRLSALCPHCTRLMNRTVRVADLGPWRARFHVADTVAEPTLSD